MDMHHQSKNTHALTQSQCVLCCIMNCFCFVKFWNTIHLKQKLDFPILFLVICYISHIFIAAALKASLCDSWVMLFGHSGKHTWCKPFPPKSQINLHRNWTFDCSVITFKYAPKDVWSAIITWILILISSFIYDGHYFVGYWHFLTFPKLVLKMMYFSHLLWFQ